MRCEIVPNVICQRVGRERAARIGLQQRHRDADVRRERVIVEEIRGVHEVAHLLLVCLGFRVLPEIGPAVKIVWSDATRGIERDRLRRLFA